MEIETKEHGTIAVQWDEGYTNALVSVGKLITNWPDNAIEATDFMMLNKIHTVDVLNGFLITSELAISAGEELGAGPEVALIALCMAMELKTHSNVNVTRNSIVRMVNEERDDRWFSKFMDLYLDISIPFSYNSGG